MSQEDLSISDLFRRKHPTRFLWRLQGDALLQENHIDMPLLDLRILGRQRDVISSKGDIQQGYSIRHNNSLTNFRCHMRGHIFQFQ